MKKSNKTIIIVILTVIVTSLVTSSIVNRQTVKTMANGILEMQAFNEVARVEAWDNIEKLLTQGCNKKALYYVKKERSASLSSIKLDIGDNQKIMETIKKRNPEISQRVKDYKKSYDYTVPKCK